MSDEPKPQILRAPAIEAMEPFVNHHFLNDNAIRRQKSLGDAAGLSQLGFHIIEVDPGHESTEYHFHHYEEECVYILAGEATITIGDRDHQVGPGDFIAYPLNRIPHTMKNTGTEVLRAIVVGQRLTQDISDYPRRNKRLYRNSGAWELVDTGTIERIK